MTNMQKKQTVLKNALAALQAEIELIQKATGKVFDASSCRDDDAREYLEAYLCRPLTLVEVDALGWPKDGE